ncbi:hypothetical protein [Adhaeribacter aquaticus]|uniref:hypothetical protein n=1 Tax=Adhaeribacter aquaticus TaxID=299567 RepID=UPI0004198429|nr:hypothetical protein [Adhaeribacter aquaticus]
MSSNKRGVEDHFIPSSGNKVVEKDEKGNIKIHTEGPTVQADDTKVQDVNRALPQGGNPVGRGQSQHNSVSGGKSLKGNNARSNPPSDKNHN